MNLGFIFRWRFGKACFGRIRDWDFVSVERNAKQTRKRSGRFGSVRRVCVAVRALLFVGFCRVVG